MIATKDGQVIMGLRVSETNFSAWLFEENGRIPSFLKRDRRRLQSVEPALMPENVAELLTVKELRDLSDYLMSLDSAAQCDPRYRDEDSRETSSFVVSVGLNRNVSISR